MRLVFPRVVLATIFGVVMFGAGAWGHSYAQVVMATPVTPHVLSGADIGFRMNGLKGDTPTGTLVVRVDGEWTEVEFTGGVKLITR